MKNKAILVAGYS